jgi:hypothetical protein
MCGRAPRSLAKQPVGWPRSEKLWVTRTHFWAHTPPRYYSNWNNGIRSRSNRVGFFQLL